MTGSVRSTMRAGKVYSLLEKTEPKNEFVHGIGA